MNPPIEFRNASTNKGSKMVNCYTEIQGDNKYVYKRPGLVSTGIDFGAGVGQGLYTYKNKIVGVVSNVLYNVTGTTPASVGSLSGTTTPCYFSNTLNDGYLFFHKKDKCYTWDGTTFSQVTNDRVGFVTVNSGGSGYTTAPTVTFTAPPSGTTATGTAQISGGIVTSISITNGGSGYVTAPSITIGTEWTASTAVSTNAQIFYAGRLYTVTTGGTTGTTAPTHTSGSAANGTATLAYAGTAATATCELNSFPASDLVPGTAYLDGYIFVMTSDGKIWNSEPEDPTKWYSLNYVTAEAESDKGVAITKHYNYVIAFGQWSTEFFYDAANPVGSPLLPNSTMRLEIGCANGDSVVQLQETVVWVGVGRNTGRAVFMLDGTRPVQMSDTSVERILDASTLANVRSYSLKVAGHYFYILNLIDDNLTLVLDIKNKEWSIWTSFLNNQESILDGSYFTSLNNVSYTLDISDGKVYNISESNYTDHSGPIQFRIRTPIIDGDATKRKFISRLEIVGDKVPATLRIRHTDDDYQNWSPYRNVNLQDTRCILFQNGSFRRRAYEFFCTDNQPLRLLACEMDIEPGNV